MAKNVSTNHQPGLTAQNELTGQNEYLQSTSQALNVYVTGGGSGGGDVNLTQVGGSPISLGQNTSSNSLPVTIASDQSSIQTQLATDVAPTTGSITANGQSITATDLSGVGAASVQISGTYSGLNVSFEATIDGTTWNLIPAQQASSTTPSVVTATGVLTTNSTNTWNVSPLLGQQQFRVRATAFGTGSATVVIEPSAQFTQQIVNVATMPTTTVTGTVTANLGTGGTAATSLGKAEDAAHASGDTGVATWGVRNDGGATSYGANNDYTPMAVDANGRTLSAFKAGTSAITSVAASATSVTILASNVSRLGATITNDSSALLYLKLGATASTTSYTVVLAGSASAPFSYYEVPYGYTGVIDGIWASATGNARVTEVS